MIEAQMLDLKNEHRQILEERLGEKQRELSSLSSQIYTLKNYIEGEKFAIQSYESQIRSLEEKIKILRESWHAETIKFFGAYAVRHLLCLWSAFAPRASK